MVPFPTLLTIERGLDVLSRKDSEKAVGIRRQIEALVVGLEEVRVDDAMIARALARILGHGPLRHTWFPNEKAKEPSYGHYPWVAATAIVTGLPIASIKTTDLSAVAGRYDLPGLYDPFSKAWLHGGKNDAALDETLFFNRISSP